MQRRRHVGSFYTLRKAQKYLHLGGILVDLTHINIRRKFNIYDARKENAISCYTLVILNFLYKIHKSYKENHSKWLTLIHTNIVFSLGRIS